MNRMLLTALVVLLALPATANALTHTAPADGASVATSHPTFAWALDGHEANVIVVSRAQRTTPSGEFFDEDRVTSDALDNADTSWQPTAAIPAGTFWWSVQWYTPDFSATGYTVPWSFTIPAVVRQVRVGVQQYSNIDDLTARPSWYSNTATTRVRCRLYRQGRVVSRDTDASSYPTIAGRNSASCDLRAKERWDGELLRLVVDVNGGGVSRSTSVRFRAR